jgi:hypothetical protein
MYRTSVGAGAVVLLALLFIGGGDRDAAAAARIWYGTCFPQFHKCMSRCNALGAGAFEGCAASCGPASSRCESAREMERREALNGNLPESTLPNARLPDSNLPDDNLPDSRLP